MAKVGVICFGLLFQLVVIILNIPFGYWRGNVYRLSWQWFLSIHIPVPMIIILRVWLDLGWGWTTFPILVGAYFSGQYIGVIWHRSWQKTMCVSGCLIRDIARSRWIILITR